MLREKEKNFESIVIWFVVVIFEYGKYLKVMYENKENIFNSLQEIVIGFVFYKILCVNYIEK